MHTKLWMKAILAVLAAGVAAAQQATPVTQSSKANATAERVVAYPVGPGVTAPDLLPTQPLEITQGKCKKKHEDTATFFLVVDLDGVPQTYFFLRPLGNNLDPTLIQMIAVY